MNIKQFVQSFDKMAAAVALIFSLALFAPVGVRAAWQPGLLGGNIIRANNNAIDKTGEPVVMEPYLDPHVATNVVSASSGTTELWKSWQTWVYTGQMYLDGSDYAFAESIDDAVFLKINDVTVLDNASHNTTTFGTISLPAGWYPFELRMFNGTGGAGPANQNNWGTTAFGFGYNKTGDITQSNPINTRFTFPADPGDGSLFRYDDGMGFDDNLQIVGSPAGVSVASPAFGSHPGFAENQSTNVSVLASWVSSAGDVVALADGWEVFSLDEFYVWNLIDSGPGTSFTYTHPGVQSKIVWNFAVSNFITATAGAGGSVSGGGWCERSGSMVVSATAAAGGAFFEWVGDVPAGLARSNPLSLPADKPRYVEARFSGAQHVSMVGNDSNDGSDFSPQSAKASIAAAVAALGPEGGVVLVDAGQYLSPTTILLDRAITVRGATGVPEDVVVYRNAPVSGVRFFHLNNAEARVEFITISGGQETNREFHGANVFIDNGGGTVADCVIRNAIANSGHAQSAANVAMYGVNSLVTRCVITNGLVHAAGSGAGVFMRGGRVEQCYIAYNSDAGSLNGAAVQMDSNNGPTLLENCTIVRNFSGSGGAVSANHANAMVRNCVIVDNVAANCVDASGSVFVGMGQAERFVNCVADVYINGRCFTTADGFGFADAAAHDYRLTALSFAVDKGAAPSASASTTDIEGKPRVIGGAVDAGCYEYQAGADGGGAGALGVTFDAGVELRHAVPFDVTFRAATVNADGAVMFTWDFGDGTVVATDSPTITHTYTTPQEPAGFVDVTVTADDGSGATATLTRPNFVRAVPPLIHVVAGATDAAHPYDTFATALPTMSAAVAAADNGTTIVVSNGMHAVSSRLEITSAIDVRGFGGARDEVLLRSPGHNNQVLFINHPGAIVRDLTIENGRSDGVGANVQIDGMGGTLTNCVVRGGESTGHTGRGAGVHLNGPASLATHCVITNNYIAGVGAGGKGAGAQLTNGARLEHSLVAANKCTHTTGDGVMVGGVHAGSGAFIVNCTISGNSSRNQGGLYIDGSGAAIVNTVIAGNASTSDGGDRNAWSHGLVAGNAAAIAAAAAAVTNGFLNCATDTAAAINETCIRVNPEALENVTAGDYHPAAGSPLVNGGAAYGTAPAVDLDGSPRVQSGDIDIGCYEFDTSSFRLTFESDIQEGITPAPITFTATVSGAKPGDTISYKWDFDNDSTSDLTTPNPVTTHTYTVGGVYAVTLTATNETTGETASMTRKAYLHFAAPILYVVNGNPSAALPYDTWDNAASDMQMAIEAAVNGCEIIVRAGVYTVASSVSIDKRLRFRSESGEPESVVLRNGTVNANYQLLRVNHPGAHVSGITLENGQSADRAANLLIDTGGGTVSNCVIRNGRAYEWSGNGVVNLYGPNALLTHCVITNNVTQERLNRVTHKSVIILDNGRIENCLIARNDSVDWGAGYTNTVGIIRLGSGVVRNCTITDNTVDRSGIIYVENANATGMIINSIIAGNTVTEPLELVGVPVWSGALAATNRFENCTVDTYVNEACVVAPATAIFKNFAAGNYQLSNNSPAIDIGPRLDPNEAAAAGIDLLGNPRIVNNRLDNGCYESRGRSTLLMVR